MVTIDDVIINLESNPNLSSEIKDNFKELIIIFNNKFPQIDLSNLHQRIKTLTIKEANNYVINEVAKYDVIGNQLKLNPLALSKDYDGKSIQMQQLLNIITSKNLKTGEIKDVNYEAINEGIAAMIANSLVGNEADNHPYIDEWITINLLEKIIGLDLLEKAYFENDTTSLFYKLVDLKINPLDIKALISWTRYNMQMRNELNNFSQLDKIQKKLIDMLIQSKELNNENIKEFKLYLFYDSNTFGAEKEKYKNIDGLNLYYEKKINESLVSENTISGKTR